MVGINLNLVRNHSVYQNKFVQKPSFNFNGIKKNKLESDVFQKSQISFRGIDSSLKDKIINNNAERIMFEYQNFHRTKTNGYPETFVDKNWFLQGQIIGLINSGSADDIKTARVVLNTLKVYPEHVTTWPVVVDNKGVEFKYQPDNDEDGLDAFMEFFQIKKPKTRGMSNDKEILEDKLETIKQTKAYEDKKEQVRSQLRPLVEKLALVNNDEDVFLPNCVMLLGDDNDMAFYAADWLKEVCPDNNFKTLEGYYDSKDEMQDDLINLLDEAEQNYNETGKRSIIFVPHLGVLINKKTNTPENIAQMKMIMQGADEDYHSTIIFPARKRDTYSFDEGTLQLNRVCLTVEI